MSTILSVAEWWLYAGAAVAVAFLVVGIGRIDEDARDTYIFRPLLVPGVILIWPLVLWRWVQLEKIDPTGISRYQPDRRIHGRLWLVFGLLIPAIFLTAVFLRQPWPEGAPAVQLPLTSEESGQ